MSDTLPTASPFEPTDFEQDKMTPEEIVNVLEGYRLEAEQNRKTGMNARDDKWEQNLNLYWNRHDFSKKEQWQSKEVLPEVPLFVDRFAAALKEALNATPTSFYTVVDDADKEGDLTRAIKAMMDVWLAKCGTNDMGQTVDFSVPFEEQMKLGALMACSGMVRWKEDVPNGRVTLDSLDPRNVWLDHTGRSLYRVRTIEIDKHDLIALAKAKDRKGDPLYDLAQVESLVSQLNEDMRKERETLTGSGQEQVGTNRKPIVLHEYVATVLDNEGKVVADKGLSIVANNRFLLRGPEKNPFWHGRDWVVYAPLIPVPLSPYGRSYMEDMGTLAKTFNELTNLMLDATMMSSMKMFAIVPSMLQNPAQVQDGAWGGKLWLLEDGVRAQDFMKEVDLGTLDQSAIAVWNAIKNELTEAASQNEVGLGQFAPNSRTSATEIVETQQGKNSLVLSVAHTVETRFLNPALDLMWKTGIQHMHKDDPTLARAVGPQLFSQIYRHRRELAGRETTFAARGISTLLQKGRRLRALMQAMQVIGSNEILLREFLQRTDPGRLVDLILDLLDVDVAKLQATERERTIRQLTEQVGQARAGAEKRAGAVPATGQEANVAQAITNTLGVGAG